MIIAMFRVMLLGLLRDRGALMMAFVLPPLIYVIFASIFSSTTGGDLTLKVAVLDLARTDTSARLADAVRGSKAFRTIDVKARAPIDIEQHVKAGMIDVGIVIRHDPGLTAATAAAPIQVVGDASRAMANPIVTGQIQRLFREHLPDAAYRQMIAEVESRLVTLTPEQKARVEATLVAVRTQVIGKRAQDPADAGLPQRGSQLVEQTTLPQTATASATVIYYAGAVGFLFLLLSATQGAMSLIDERQSGLIDRLVGGGIHPAWIVCGKFLFLIGLGVIQTLLIFAVAAAAFGVPLLEKLPGWAVITGAASVCSAGLGLALAASCRTRQQAGALSSFLVLVLSALGGSMVPRFLMPPWLQDLSWAIPNAWGIEAYNSLIWRNAAMTEIVLPITLLVSTGLAGALFAAIALGGALKHRASGTQQFDLSAAE
jgi:ABC-2 type transport system permease protein